jgi:ornithine cyclodeaminase
MVPFVGVQSMRSMIAARGIEPLFVTLASYIEADFLRWPAFEKAPRVASHSADGVIELMPTSDGEHYTFKYVNGHPRNAAHGLQTVTAFGVLADVQTGYPVFVSEMTLATALRTAATSALAARALCRAGSRTMAIIGLGAQSEFQALAFKALLGITSLRVYDIDPRATEKFMRNMAGPGVDIVVCSDARETVSDADIVTTLTAGKRNAAVLTSAMIQPGVHINAVGGDCPGKTELDPALVRRATSFVEFEAQTRIEGELQQMPAGHAVTELWRVLTGAHPGRRSADDITLFDSVGFAIEDFSTLRFLRDVTRDMPFCETIDLIAAPSDPRNLYGLLAQPAALPGR